MKRLAAMCLTALLLMAVASCGKEREKFIIGVSQCSEDSWRAKLNEELRLATYLYDDVEVVFASADDKDNKQIEQINAFIRRKVDLLVVSPNQMNIISGAVDKAYDSGIPVILLDRKTGSGKYTAFIGADNVDIGNDMADFIAEQLDGHGRIVEIQGLVSSSPAVERHRGFVEALKRYPGIELVDSRYGNWLQASGQEAMDSIMATGKKFDCVFSHNDRMAVGAYELMKKRGLADGIMFTGIDALTTPDGGIARVQDSTLTASCIYPTRGDLVMKLAMDILEGREYKKENPLKAALVTRGNADVMMMQAEEIASQNKFLETLHGKVDTYLAQYHYQKVYFTLFAVIVVLLIVFFVMSYRAILVRRRIVEDTANAKLVFFTNMSHEFRTPLTLIADPVQRMLNDDNLTERQRERLAMVNRNAQILLRLVSEILEFRRLQNGKMKLELTWFNLSDYLHRWIEGFRPTAEMRGLTVNADISGGLIVCSDLYKVERICYNLLSNAIKYSTKGGTVTVKAVCDGEQVKISVSDTGIGIPKDKLAHVFDRFFQVKSNPTGGTGIGLALVKAFTEIMQGSVAVESEEGRGSTFTVILPVKQPGGAEPEPDGMTGNDGMTPEPALNSRGQAVDTDNSSINPFARMDDGSAEKRPTVLITDDNDDIRAYISSLLSDKYNILFAADGREGLEKATKNVPDLIVCDVMMPVMDGIEMCRQVKQQTATSHIPVLMLTARSLEEQRTEGYECGADGYLTKPFSGSVLISRVANLLETRRKLRELFNAGSLPETTENGPGNADVDFIKEFRKHVNERMIDSELSVETLSSEMGLSRVQLYRKVKALTGHTPVEIIRLSRLNRAEQLLKAGGRTVSEISYEVGFSSPSYFIKCYKEQFGHTPAEKA